MTLPLFSRSPEVDFSALLWELRKAGYGSSVIGVAGGWGKQTVQWWRDNKNCIPNFEDGRLLVQIYEFVFKLSPPTKRCELQVQITAANAYS